MYLEYYENERETIDKFDTSKHPGETLMDFITNVDDTVLMSQLYFFSKTFIHDEAIKNVKTLNTYFFVEHFNTGIDKLNLDLELNLKPIHNRKSGNYYKPKKGEIKF